MNKLKDAAPWILLGCVAGVVMTAGAFGLWYSQSAAGDETMLEEPMHSGEEYGEVSGGGVCEPEPVLAQLDEEVAGDYLDQGPKELLGAAAEVEKNADIISSQWVKAALLYRKVQEAGGDSGDSRRAGEGLERLHRLMTTTQLADPEDECRIDRAAYEYMARFGLKADE